MTIIDVNVLKERLAKFGQEQLLKFWHELGDEERQQLCLDIEELNLMELKQYFEKATASLSENSIKLDDRIQPIPETKLVSIARAPSEKLSEYRAEGLRQISKSRVGVLLMAGGQGEFLKEFFYFLFVTFSKFSIF